MTDAADSPSFESLNAKIADLEAQVKTKDQMLAAYAESLGKLRGMLVVQAQENFTRVNEIMTLLELAVNKAQSKPAAA